MILTWLSSGSKQVIEEVPSNFFQIFDRVPIPAPKSKTLFFDFAWFIN
jgi:hypothetical protein